MPLPLLLAAPAIAKGALGLYQLTQHVNRQDTITAAEREQVALARQAAAAQLPGYAGYQARLAQAQSAAQQAATVGAGSSSDFLAAASATDRVRTQGEGQLTAQAEQQRGRATQTLMSVLGAYGRHEQADTDKANQANAQLKGAAFNNLFGGLTDGASVAAYSAAQKDSPGNSGAAGVNYNPNYPAGDYPYRRRTGPYGYGSIG
ncbi:MAG: hypothetical protein ACRYFX_18900 [Janthinobacterium lividum]